MAIKYQHLIEHHSAKWRSWHALDHDQQAQLIGALVREHTNIDWAIDAIQPSDLHLLVGDCIEKPESVRNASLASYWIAIAWKKFEREAASDLNEALAERRRAMREPDEDAAYEAAYGM